MFNNMNKRITDVFSLKLKLSNVVCTILVSSTIILATLALLLYHYIIYLGRPIPLWGVALAVPTIVILAHFSLVAMKGLVKGVRNN